MNLRRLNLNPHYSMWATSMVRPAHLLLILAISLPALAGTKKGVIPGAILPPLELSAQMKAFPTNRGNESVSFTPASVGIPILSNPFVTPPPFNAYVVTAIQPPNNELVVEYRRMEETEWIPVGLFSCWTNELQWTFTIACSQANLAVRAQHVPCTPDPNPVLGIACGPQAVVLKSLPSGPMQEVPSPAGNLRLIKIMDDAPFGGVVTVRIYRKIQ